MNNIDRVKEIPLNVIRPPLKKGVSCPVGGQNCGQSGGFFNRFF